METDLEDDARGRDRGIPLTVQQVSPPSGIAAAPQSVDWAYWGADERSSRYSPLEQINAENFGDLEIAWRWKAANYGPEPDYIYRAWRIPNGETPDRIKNHPAFEGVTLPNTGQNSLVTKTLLMYGEGRSGDPYFRAVDKQTGKEIAKVELPAPTHTAPMTFMHDGRQYIVMAVAGGHAGVEAELVALALPSEP